jgi:hypothetical protein
MTVAAATVAKTALRQRVVFGFAVDVKTVIRIASRSNNCLDGTAKNKNSQDCMLIIKLQPL